MEDVYYCCLILFRWYQF